MGNVTEVIANSYPVEGTLTGEKTITLPWRARYIEIINDNSGGTLLYKFNATENYATLKPLEVYTTHVISKTIFLSGDGLYRLRAEG